MCLLLVYVYSYGVFRQALFFGNKKPYWGVINDILYKPYWHVYGELFVEHQGGFPVAVIGCIPQGPVVRSLVSTNRWLRGIKTYRFPWYLTLVSANHASSKPGLLSRLLCITQDC